MENPAKRFETSDRPKKRVHVTKIVSVPQSGTHSAIVCSMKQQGVLTHWWRSRTAVHLIQPNECVLCSEHHAPLKWKWAILCYDPRTKAKFFLEYTEDAAASLDEQIGEVPLRGRILQYGRIREGKRQPICLILGEPIAEISKLPKPEDCMSSWLCLWGLDKD